MLSRFLRDCRGGVAPMFAIAVIPMIGLTMALVWGSAEVLRAWPRAAIAAVRRHDSEPWALPPASK